MPNQKKSATKAPFTRLTLPLQCDLRLSAAKRNSITHAAAARSNLDAAIAVRSADTELQNTIELRTTAPQIAAILQLQNRDLDAKAEKRRFEARFKRNFKRKIINAKIQKKTVPKAPFTRLTLPLQCDLRLSAAKRNGITHAAAARSNLDAAISLRSADTELQSTIELRTTAPQIADFAAPKPDLYAKAERRRFWSAF